MTQHQTEFKPEDEKQGETTQLVPRTTVTQICARRRNALALYEKAYTAIDLSNIALRDAAKEAQAAGPVVSRFNHHTRGDDVGWLGGNKLPELEKFMESARRIVDNDVWAHIIELTGLERLMDKTAKDQFAKQLQDNPPEVSEENIEATLRQLGADQDMIFKRGIAECFSR
ncbi:MAG: DUF4942 domain-containing protein [Woeseiaceae bacterium]|nr:DUF4942 domain-containing protein [Woeseiaceae bacterium]